MENYFSCRGEKEKAKKGKQENYEVFHLLLASDLLRILLNLAREAYHEQISRKNFLVMLMKNVTSLTWMIDGSCDVLTSFPICFHQICFSLRRLFRFFSILGVANNPLGIDWKSKRWSRWLPNTKHETPMRKSAIKWCRFIGPQVFLRSKDEIRLPGKFVITHALCKSCLSYCEEIRSGWFGDS